MEKAERIEGWWGPFCLQTPPCTTSTDHAQTRLLDPFLSPQIPSYPAKHPHASNYARNPLPNRRSLSSLGSGYLYIALTKLEAFVCSAGAAPASTWHLDFKASVSLIGRRVYNNNRSRKREFIGTETCQAFEQIPAPCQVSQDPSRTRRICAWPSQSKGLI